MKLSRGVRKSGRCGRKYRWGLDHRGPGYLLGTTGQGDFSDRGTLSWGRILARQVWVDLGEPLDLEHVKAKRTPRKLL